MGDSLRNTPPCMRRSRKNRQPVEEESHPGELDLDNEGSSED